MTTELEAWLRVATRHLSRDSAADVRTEIQEHYDSALAAGHDALAALGDPKAANREYRRVMLTSAEARMLRSANWEAGAYCSIVGLKWMLLALPVGALVAGVAFYAKGSMDLARSLLVGGIAMGLVLAAPFLPVYTPSRARIFRILKLALMTAALANIFGSDVKMSWLMASCIWTIGWIEWTRGSIRRKLPVAKWPKQLYL